MLFLAPRASSDQIYVMYHVCRMSSTSITPIITIFGILALHVLYERRQKRGIDDMAEKRMAERKGVCTVNFGTQIDV